MRIGNAWESGRLSSELKSMKSNRPTDLTRPALAVLSDIFNHRGKIGFQTAEKLSDLGQSAFQRVESGGERRLVANHWHVLPHRPIAHDNRVHVLRVPS